jgi:hypothetical protein
MPQPLNQQKSQPSKLITEKLNKLQLIQGLMIEERK